MSTPAASPPCLIKPTTLEKIHQILLYEIHQNKKNFWHLPPEDTEYVTDRFSKWAETLLSTYKELFTEFVCTVTQKELEDLITNYLNNENWPVHRRAFFSELLYLIKQIEKKEIAASNDIAHFYRERYNPNYRFISEISLSPK